MNKNTPHFLQLTGEFPEGQLIPTRLSGHAGLSELYRYQVDCIISIEKDKTFALSQSDQYINTFVQIEVHAPDQNTLIINGIIDELNIDLSALTATFYISPAVKLLEKSSKNEIYTQLSTQEIIRKILNDTQLSQKPYFDFETADPEGHESDKISYIAQYNESNLHFLLRVTSYFPLLMFFVFKPKKHILTLANNQCLELSDTTFTHSSSKKNPHAIYAWQVNHQLMPEAIKLSDVDPDNPFHSIHASYGKNPETTFQEFSSGLNNTTEGDKRIEVSLNRIQSKKKIFCGKTHNIELHPGLVIDIDNTKYLVISTYITAKSHGHNNQTSNFFECEFRASQEINQFKDANCYIKPSFFGVHTARVDNDLEKPILLNSIGAVKASLDFNASGSSYQSPWMRVMQTCAGNNHGHLFIPRHGHEVWISYLNGNIDRPLIIGSAYSSTNSPSYTLPLEQSTSGIKHTSVSSKRELPGQYNELSFNNETGEESITLKAQKNYSEIIENDALCSTKGRLLSESQSGNIEHVAHDGAISVAAKKNILFQCGQSAININPSSISLNSPQIALNPSSDGSGANGKSTLLNHQEHVDSMYSMFKEDTNITS